MRTPGNKQQPQPAPGAGEHHHIPFEELFGSEWNPQPIRKPEIDRELHERDPLTRSAESIRYSVLSLEFWISPDGQVREWLRNNTRVAVLLGIPAFLVLPVVSFALWQLVSWLTALASIAGQLIILPALSLLAAAVLSAVFLVARAVIPRK